MNTRLRDFKKSLMSAIDKALEAEVHLAVFAGDAYKSRDPRQTDQREFADCIRKLTEAGIPVVMLTGNHDMPAVRGRANSVEIYRTLAVQNVHVIAKPQTLVVPTAAGAVRIAALPYLMKGFSVAREDFQGKTMEQARLMLEEKYVGWIHDLAEEAEQANDDLPTILMGHFWVTGAGLSTWQAGYFTRDEPQVALSALTNQAFDYVALGHIHRHQDLNRGGYPAVVYSGSPDRIDFGEKDETKGFVLVHLARGATRYEFVPVAESRAFLEIEVDADCDEPTEKIVSAIKRHSLRNAIVKLRYTIGADRQSLVREREIREALSYAFQVVSIQRRVQRDGLTRSRGFHEGKSPRENLELFIDTNAAYQPHKTRLLEMAETLFVELAQEEAL
jgi:exonuclease SbcD